MNTKGLLIGAHQGVNLYAIPGYSQYSVSEWGLVYSNHLSDWLVRTLEAGRYFRVGIQSDDGESKTVRIHRLMALAFFGDADGEVDHINRSRLDNRLENLRMVTPVQNRQNKVGLGFAKRRNKWAAYVKHNGKKVYAGLHSTQEQATAAYLAKKAELGHIL